MSKPKRSQTLDSFVIKKPKIIFSNLSNISRIFIHEKSNVRVSKSKSYGLLFAKLIKK